MSTINLQEFEQIVGELKRNIEYYENCLETNKYFLGLANGENLNITFPRNRIPHLLGIQIDKLAAAGIVRMDTPIYEVVKKLINSDITYIGLKNHNFDADNLFSKYVVQKLHVFTDIIKLRTDDLVCIIKYYSDRSYSTGELAQNSDYFIIRKHDENTYSALGIKKEYENSNNYIPVTARYFENKDELNEFLYTLKNQEITYPHTFSIQNYFKDYSNKIYSKIENKLNWCRTSKQLSDKFGLVPVNNNDLIIVLEKFLNSIHDKDNSKAIMYYIADCIKNGVIIDKKEIKETKDIAEIPEELEALIDSINDHIYSNSNFEVGSEYSYSSFTNEIEILDKKLNDKEKELDYTKEELEAAKQEIEKLKAELALSNKCLDMYEEASSKVYELRKAQKQM